ncbi:MAG: hypothetical protein LBE55_04460 [Clostridiales bacterium]|jgi:hypothetical protein|nr:hypothetical protein [Clostridiales bacterium]
MFKQAIIHHPTDPKIMRQISKDIAIFHSMAAVEYMDSQNLCHEQKLRLIDSLVKELPVSHKPK